MLPRAKSSWRPPWFETQITSTPCWTAIAASSAVCTPLSRNGPSQISRMRLRRLPGEGGAAALVPAHPLGGRQVAAQHRSLAAAIDRDVNGQAERIVAGGLDPAKQSSRPVQVAVDVELIDLGACCRCCRLFQARLCGGADHRLWCRNSAEARTVAAAPTRAQTPAAPPRSGAGSTRTCAAAARAACGRDRCCVRPSAPAAERRAGRSRGGCGASSSRTRRRRQGSPTAPARGCAAPRARSLRC